MRKVLGVVVLVAGVGGLGWFASQGPARSIEAQLSEAAANVAGEAIHGVSAAVSGRDIIVSGTVNDAAERDSLLAAFEAIPGRRVIVADAVEALPVASPFFFSLAKSDTGLNALGNAPSAAISSTLDFDGLDVAAGAPDGWLGAVQTTLSAIETLKTANVVMADANVAVTGVAADPDALAAFNTAFAELPEGYGATSDIEVLDDGTPLRLALAYDGTTLSGSGKIPADLALADVTVTGADLQLDVQEARLPSADGAWGNAAQAAIAALGAMQSGDLSFEDKAAELTGTATPDGIAAAEAALAGLPDGYVVETAFTLPDDGAPFALTLTKTADGLTGAGKVPADFDVPDGLDGLDVAFITDDTGVWPGIAEAGLAALQGLDTGELTIADGAVTLTGDAFSPAEQSAALAALDGYDVTSDISLQDDGTPLSLTLTYRSETGAAVSGKLPAGISIADVAEALDLEVTDAGAVASVLESDIDFLAPLEGLRGFLPEISGLTYVAGADQTSIEATTDPGVATEQLAGAMQAAFGDDVVLNVRPRTDLPANGTNRLNRFSGREEVFTAGYWLPAFDFFTTPESCTEQSDMILGTDKVRFLSGSAELDVQSVRAINALSALARKCAVEGGVFVQVAGHTDNTGDPAANLALSEARANSVRDAMLDRGLARVVVSAVGYGDTQPIADNDTEDGRATNRRTEFIWNFQ